MKVSQAIELLKTGELKQLSLKNNDDDILGYINMGILELHKRFVLRQTDAVVDIVNGTTVYALDGVDPNVTLDLTESEFLKINSITNDMGEPVSLNNEYDTQGVVTPTINKIKLLKDFHKTGATQLIVDCRTAPKFLTHIHAEIDLPPQMIEALFHYVGYRGHGSVSGDIKFENNTHYVRFDKSCERIKLEGLYEEDNLESTKFQQSTFNLVGY